MPKIFGDDFHEIDFERSALRLRLDDMPERDALEFAFAPWPRKYSPSRKQIGEMVTSVHVNFIGKRPRVGFRFEVPHAPSRVGVSQDDIDKLRSRDFPRQAQDQQFIDEARDRICKTFGGDARRDLRILTVDLGEKGAHAAVYRGAEHQMDVGLKIVKIDKLYTGIEKKNDGNQTESPPGIIALKEDDRRGLRKEHVARHSEAIALGAAELAEFRNEGDAILTTLRIHDFRGLKRHVKWMIRDWARHNASQIIAVAEEYKCDVIVFESLRGFRLPGYDTMETEKKRRLAMFSFGRIRRKVAEKAVERGMRVVTVPYFMSSQFCSRCCQVQENKGLLRKNKLKRKFICEHDRCKAQLNSDANAARVLARVFWGELVLPAPQTD